MTLVETALAVAVAAVAAGFLTLFDLDRTFYVPAATDGKRRLYIWWFAFVIGNAALASLLFLLIRGEKPFSEWNPYVAATITGVGYLAIVRSKFTTFSLNGQDVPFGLEAFYEAAKGFVFKRINRIAKAARMAETLTYAEVRALAQLVAEAKLSVQNDQVMTAEQKRDALEWLLRVAQDGAVSEADKKMQVANFVLSGRQT